MTKSRDQGSGIRDQASEVSHPNEHTSLVGDPGRDQEKERMKQLLREALPAVGADAEPDRDLWPAMLRRMDEQSTHGAASVPWFDWVLAGGLLAFVSIAPRAIPVILYYL
jgi:hypothetical protein